MNFPGDIERAHARIEPYVRRTALEPAHTLGDANRKVFFKLECLQHTRSFKVRGALNKLLSLSTEEGERGIVTASTGNHGLAVTFGSQQTGIRSTIYLPENASPRKVELLERYGAEVSFFGVDSVYTEVYARKQAAERRQVFVSPYNDPFVVAGQGTIAIELLQQLPALDAVFVPVGGGGMIGGIAAYLKAVRPAVRVIGCLPENSPVMWESIQAGEIVAGTVKPTLSDGTAGGIEDQAITFALCKDFVDHWVMVSEGDIRAAMKRVFDEYGLVIEGAAGVSVASYLKFAAVQHSPKINHVAIVLCGGNVDIEVFKKIVMG